MFVDLGLDYYYLPDDRKALSCYYFLSVWKKCLFLPSFLEKIYNFISDEKNVST
jgi:hypothetical protein